MLGPGIGVLLGVSIICAQSFVDGAEAGCKRSDVGSLQQTGEIVVSWDTWAYAMVINQLRRKSWGFPPLELAWFTPYPLSCFCWLSKWRTIYCLVKLTFWQINEQNQLTKGSDVCQNTAAMGTMWMHWESREQEGMQLAVLTGSESVGFGCFFFYLALLWDTF